MTPTAVITGTTHGIGTVTSRELARAGYRVVMLCRDVAAAARVGADIGARVPGARLEVVPCELASLASVRAAADAVLARTDTIDLLVNNAGMVSVRHQRSADGFELTFASNQLGPFLLTERLRGRMARSARIVNVASRVHYKGALALDSVDDPHAPYGAQRAYAQSKLANVMWTAALARRLDGSGVTANSLHPGVITSNLLPRWLQVLKPLVTRGMFDVEEGARTTLYLALDAAVAGTNGGYFDEYQRPQTPSAIARDTRLQEQLWSACERWTAAFSR
jgi:NAD(P)-dependent dehydrogenase (short-subunit alcohol dehydrogenase family)